MYDSVFSIDLLIYMHHQFLNRILCIAGLTTVVLNLSPSAQALPGQSVQTVTQWAKQHPLLSPFKRGIGELSGMPFYNSQATVKTGTIYFSMNPDQRDKQSREETIAYSTKTQFDGFTRTNAKGLDLIRSIYGPAIVSDFQKSRYLARVDFNPHEEQFYRGQQFGYHVVRFKEARQAERFFHLSVVPLSDLDTMITNSRLCRKQSAFGCGD
jgi:hypothetical protein